MRILSITHAFPMPPDDGTRVRVWNILSRMAARHELLALTPLGPERRGIEAPSWLEVCASASPSMSFIGRIRRRASSVVLGVPAAQLASYGRGIRRRIEEVCASGWPDVVVAEDNSSGSALRFVPKAIPTVWVKHSIMAVDAEQRQGGRSAFGAWTVRRFEGRTCRRAALVVALTREDADGLRERYGIAQPADVPNGVDPDLFPWRPDPGGHVVAFVGDFRWQANADALGWLIGEIWPLVRQRVPQAQLRLIGKGLDPRGMRATDGIEPLGYVDDVSVALSDAAVGVVPVRLGTGIRCKLTEFIATGLPSVSTRLGTFGVPVVDGEHVLVRDDAESFADAVAHLLAYPAERERMSAAAATIVPLMSWDARVDELERLLARVVGSAGDERVWSPRTFEMLGGRYASGDHGRPEPSPPGGAPTPRGPVVRTVADPRSSARGTGPVRWPGRKRTRRAGPTVSEASLLAGFVAAAALVGATIARSDVRAGPLSLSAMGTVGVVAFVLSIPFLFRRWRLSLGILLVWLVLEDLIRKFSGNDLRVYFAKDAIFLLVLVGLVLDPSFRQWWTQATGRVRFLLYALVAWSLIMSVPSAWVDPRLPLLGLRLDFMYAPLVAAGFAIGLRQDSVRRWLLFASAIAASVSLLGVIQATIGPSFLSPGQATPGLVNLELYRGVGDVVVYRPTATFVDPGRFASLVVLGLAMSLAAFAICRGRQRLLALGCAILNGAGIWVSGGRAGLVIGILLVLFAATAGPLAEGRLTLSRAFAIMGGVVAAALVLSALLPAVVGDRFTWYSETLDPRSSYNEWALRVESWVENTARGVDVGGLAGRGTGTESLGKQYLGGDPDVRGGLYTVEGGYASVAVEIGVIGVALWLAWSLAWLRRQWRSIRVSRRHRLAGAGFVLFGWMLSFLVFGFVTGLQAFQNYIGNAYFWMLSGVIFAIPVAASSPSSPPRETASLDVAT